MKKLTGVLLCAAILVFAQFGSVMAGSGDPAEKSKALFVVKTDRKLVGGKVEILSSDGAVVARQTLQKKKMFIDFSDVEEGTYTIRVSKGDEVKEFLYRK